MNKKLLVIIGIACLTFLGVFLKKYTLRIWHTYKVHQLVSLNRFKDAQNYLLSKNGIDSTIYYDLQYCIAEKDPAASVNIILKYIAKQYKLDSNEMAENWTTTWQHIKFKLSNDHTLSPEGLTMLSGVIKPKAFFDSVLFLLKKTALQKQTVQAWNNCIAFGGKINPMYNAWVSLRRKIYFDTLKLLKSNISVEALISQNPCYIPILKRINRIRNTAYTLDDLYNPEYSKSNVLASRFIIGDFNSTDLNGECRGTRDYFSSDTAIDEFKPLFKYFKNNAVKLYNLDSVKLWYQKIPASDKSNLYASYWNWINYLEKVNRYKTTELVKDPLIEINGITYCIGQRLCLCEIKNDTILRIAQFITSSRNVKYGFVSLQDYDGTPRYYAPKCIITTRYWDRQQQYDSLDFKRDKIMGFGSSAEISYQGVVGLPNFLHMTPDNEFAGAFGFVNGIHEFAVGGPSVAMYMGTPISLGCVRLHDYPSKFIRWWIPKGARFFIYYDQNRYVQINSKQKTS